MRYKLPPNLYELWLSEQFPEFQESIRASSKISFGLDLSEVIWLNPLPLLAITTEVSHSLRPDCELQIDLGSISRTKTNERHLQAIKFFTDHGFLSAIANSRSDSIHVCFYDDSDCRFITSDVNEVVQVVKATPSKLRFGDIIPIPATVLSVADGPRNRVREQIRKIVDDLTRHADRTLYKYRTSARIFRSTTLHRFNQVLLELVENCFEHAYSEGQLAHVGIYSRVVEALTEDAVKAREEDSRNSVSLRSIRRHDEPIEIMVVDVGKGLYHSLESEYTNRLQPGASGVFYHPCSRFKRSLLRNEIARGNATGLMHVDHVLGTQGDHSFIISNREMLSTQHPRRSASSGWRLIDPRSRRLIRGTLFHVGMTASPSGVLPARWFDSTVSSSWQLLKSVSQALSLASNSKSVASAETLDLQNRSLSKVVEAIGKSSARVLYVSPGKIVDKNSLFEIIRNWYARQVKLAELVTRQRTRWLILSDLGRFQSVDVDWMLQHFRVRPDQSVKARLCLLSEDLSAHFYQFNPSTGRADFDTPTAEELSEILLTSLRVLRQRDSVSLANRIRELEAMQIPILFRDVIWSGGLIVPRFIEFATLIKDPQASRVIRRALRRTLSLFPYANDNAIDPVVDATLHDARKWLIRPSRSQSNLVLVGSISVTGGTLDKVREAEQVGIAGIIDCIQGPTFEYAVSDSPPHLYAISCEPFPAPSRTGYRRLGTSPFITSESNQILDPGQNALYATPGIERLMKIGHWSYSNRHSLVDMNTELIMEQSTASLSGPIPWIAQQILDSGQRKVCLAFPHQKLAYRLAQLIHREIGRRSQKTEVHLLPLLFLPRISGGISRFTPTTNDHVESTAKVCSVCFFVDVGYLSGRTFRHSLRQLIAGGFPNVFGTGILNRSSIPEQGVETRNGVVVRTLPSPSTFWRWPVGSLGSSHNCALCTSLQALSEYKEAIRNKYADVQWAFAEFARDWSPHDVSDFWNEHGLESSHIKATTPTLDFVTGHQSTTTLLSHLVEQTRTTGDFTPAIQKLSSIVRSLDLSEGRSDLSCLELLSAFVILCNSGMNEAEQVSFATLCVEVLLSADRPTQPALLSDRYRRVVGLSALAFCGLANKVRGRLGKNFSDLAFTRSDEPLKLAALLCAFGNFTTSTNSDLLSFLPKSLRPPPSNPRISLSNLVDAFGRAPKHESSSLSKHLHAISRAVSNSRKLTQDETSKVERFLTVLSRVDPDFAMEAFDIDVRNLIDSGNRVLITPEFELLNSWIADISKAAKSLHDRLIRVEDTSVAACLIPIIDGSLQSQSFANVLADFNAARQRWTGLGDYLVVANYLSAYLDEIFLNARDRHQEGEIIQSHGFSGLPAQSASAFYTLEIDSENSSVTLKIANKMKDPSRFRQFRKTNHYAESLGLRVDSTKIDVNRGESYYLVTIRIPTLRSVLEGFL